MRRPQAARSTTTGLLAEQPVDPCAVQQAPGGRVAVRVLPHGVWDRLLLNGFSAEVAHPRTIKELGVTLDEAIAELRYGTVGLNAWTGVGYLTATPSWGAFPGTR